MEREATRLCNSCYEESVLMTFKIRTSFNCSKHLGLQYEVLRGNVTSLGSGSEFVASVNLATGFPGWFSVLHVVDFTSTALPSCRGKTNTWRLRSPRTYSSYIGQEPNWAVECRPKLSLTLFENLNMHVFICLKESDSKTLKICSFKYLDFRIQK